VFVCAFQPSDWSISTNQNLRFLIRRIFAVLTSLWIVFIFFVQFKEILIYFCTIWSDTNKTYRCIPSFFLNVRGLACSFYDTSQLVIKTVRSHFPWSNLYIYIGLAHICISRFWTIFTCHISRLPFESLPIETKMYFLMWFSMCFPFLNKLSYRYRDLQMILGKQTLLRKNYNTNWKTAV
jgi:hypothetical protein